MPDFYRYFVGFVPPEPVALQITQLQKDVGELGSYVRNLHMTLFVLAEPKVQDPTILEKVNRALDGHRLEMCPIRLGRIEVNNAIAMLRTIGRHAELNALHEELRGLLLRQNIEPMYAQTFEPHVTLGYRSSQIEKYLFPPFLWPATELVLIESHVGLGKHVTIGRWPLLPPTQQELFASLV